MVELISIPLIPACDWELAYYTFRLNQRPGFLTLKNNPLEFRSDFPERLNARIVPLYNMRALQGPGSAAGGRSAAAAVPLGASPAGAAGFGARRAAARSPHRRTVRTERFHSFPWRFGG